MESQCMQCKGKHSHRCEDSSGESLYVRSDKSDIFHISDTSDQINTVSEFAEFF